MTDHKATAGDFSDDMSDFLQIYLDETEEQLDGLVETMLALEEDSTKKEDLNEAFRLIHSIKGSAGMMGFDSITALTHHLENRFERFRSNTEQLDDRTMSIVLRSIDFLRQCNGRLRAGEKLGCPTDLFDELRRLEEQAAANRSAASATVTATPSDAEAGEAASAAVPEETDSDAAIVRIVVRFLPGIQLADLKAQLIVSRLSKLGEVRTTEPDLPQISDAEQLEEFSVCLETREDREALRVAADVDGVASVTVTDAATEPAPQTWAADAMADPSTCEVGGSASAQPTCESAMPAAPLLAAAVGPSPVETRADLQYAAVQPPVTPGKPASDAPRQEEASDSTTTEKGTARVAETMRVDTDRLDSLMNLAGELVVNRARLVQVTRQISPALRKASMLDRIREFRDGLGRTVEKLQSASGDIGDLAALAQQLRAGMELMDEQAAIWDNGRYCFGQITEAIDQLSRVSHSLQRAVLDTRMVPVGPLFHRFKRVVRDLSKECGKTVALVVRGEKTELDKRMIDELGDPLVHLVRNSIDHGLELPDVRVARNKPEVGTILLEASHRGNNVFIRVQDDGAGIDVARIKAKLIDRQILSASAVAELSDAQALDYIWHPGFSTAREVTDISGRGVGMDVVKTRISVLNGTVAVETTPLRGTSFTLRLPLTLAIINALLVRVEDTVFSMPIDDVREIVSVKAQEIITVHGKQTFEVRGEFVPLVSVHEVFQGCGITSGQGGVVGTGHASCGGVAIEAVILHAGGKTLGLRVDELLGCQDVVIKSLAENFINIRGLSGASILGDGSVCLMLDVGTLLDMAARPSRTAEIEDQGP